MPEIKVSLLPELTAPSGGVLLIVIDDPGGTPVSRRATASNLLKRTQADSTTLPTVAEAGSVNVSAAYPTDRFVEGRRVLRRTVRGYLPNTRQFANKVNGVAGMVLFSTPKGGRFVAARGTVGPDPAATFFSTQSLVEQLSRDMDSLHILSLESSTRVFYLCANSFRSAPLAKLPFVAWVEYTDPENAT